MLENLGEFGKILIKNGNYLFLKCSGIAQSKDIPNTSATTLALMEHFETVDELANADLDELTAFVNKAGHGRFADPEATAKAVQAAARGSFRLPQTVNNSINQVMSVSIAAMRALESQIKALEKAIEQQFEIIPNPLTSIPGIGKVYSAGIIAEIDVTDRDGAIQMILLNLDNLSCVKKFLVDVGYSGERFANQIKEICGAQVEVVKRNELHKFVVLPRRRVVERLFVCLDKFRRL